MHFSLGIVKKITKRRIVLFFALVVGGFYRFYKLNWDQGKMLHPDERNIATAVERISFFKQLDPGFFAYNGLWIYLTRFSGELYTKLRGYDQMWFSEWSNVNTVSRFLSASFSLGSILLMYFIGSKLLHKKGGIWAAILTAVSVGFIQYSHFGVTESLLVFWVLCLTLLSILSFGHPSKKRYWFLSALVFGLSVGTKTSAISFATIPVVTFLLSLRHKLLRKKLILLAPILLVVGIISFISVSPYSILNFDKFRESMKYEAMVVTGEAQVPYNLQFRSTTPYLYFINNLPWHLGPFIPFFGMLGLLLWVKEAISGRLKNPAVPLLLFTLVYFALVGSWYTKFVRYMFPIYPFLILGTVFLFSKIESAKSKLLSMSLVAVTLFGSFLWASAFFSIYLNENSAISASRWIYEHIPRGSSVLTEHWDEGMPLFLKGCDRDFQFIVMENYEPDNELKLDLLADWLRRGDYLFISSRRLYGSIINASDKYPLTSKYYKELFSSKLGYFKINEFSSYPSLGPITINDDNVEETFQVYDHSKVLVFKNVEKLSHDDLRGRLSD